MALSQRLADLWYDFCYSATHAAFFLGWGMRYEGRRNVPRKGPVLLLANHESFFDPPAVGIATARRVYFLARKTLFRNPLFGALLRSLHSVPVDQQGVAKEGLKAILELLQAGEVVVVFPEGERTWTGPMQPLKPGILLVLKRLDVTLIPVGIAGAFEAFPRTQKWPRLAPPFLPPTGADLAVSIGEPIPSARYKDMPREKILDDLFQAISRQRQRAQRLRRKTWPRLSQPLARGRKPPVSDEVRPGSAPGL
jgi:1-acyl-sn-glycerol-3-phosphate acyltransferase